MACGWWRLAVSAVLAVGGACRVAPRSAIDAELASCVPPDTRLLAGAHLDQIRANPALQKVVAGWLALFEPARDASTVLVAYTGSDLLWAARGQFRTAPASATLLNPQLAVAGPGALVRTATAQHARGRTGAPALMAQAEAVGRQPIWAVVTGAAP